MSTILTNTPDNLPEPDADAQARSEKLKLRIRQACDRNNGWISFAEYMNFALYEPVLGYYSGGLQKFGEQGDFITAPEVSPLFGQCLANQLADIMKQMQAVQSVSILPVSILEFGAGSGVLAVELLKRLQTLDSLPERYYIIELSAELRQRQQALIKSELPGLYGRVQWLDRLDGELDTVIVVANEVLDAMPVEVFRQGEHRLQYLQVGLDHDVLVSRFIDMDEARMSIIDSMRERSHLGFAAGYTSEYNPSIDGWLLSVSQLAKNMMIFVIDYGYNELEYYHDDRQHGTLMCYYRHRAHDDFFWWPGLQDITAFVNFTDLAYHAVDLGLDVAGYTTQAAFLLANGLSELHAEQVSDGSDTDSVRQQVRLSQQVKTLTLPSEMGERFKVMALGKNLDVDLAGFSLLDMRNRL